MSGKRIVLVSNTSWFIYNFCRGLLTTLKRQGLEVICLAPHDEYSSRLVREFGIAFHAMPMDGKSTGAWGEAKCLFWLFRRLHELSPDFVLNYTIKANIYSGLACRLLRLPYVNTITGLGTAFLHDAWLFRQARRLYGAANAGALQVFFLNSDDLQLFADTGLLSAVDYRLLPGAGIDVTRFAFAPLPTELPFTFVMVARLLGDKGVREYVRAAESVRQRYPESRFLIVGPKGVSNRTAITEDEISVWRQRGVIEYVGAQEDVRPWLRQAHVLVLPSYREGMPSTVLEAAAIGRPAIVSDVPGCRQAVVAGETGWLCQAKDADSLAERMLACLELPHSTLAEAGMVARRRVEREFSQEIVISGYLACLEMAPLNHQDVSMEA